MTIHDLGATVYTKQARRSKRCFSYGNRKGTIYAPGKDTQGKYAIYRLCENYAGHVRGGIAKTWRYTDKGLSLEKAKERFEEKLGYKIY